MRLSSILLRAHCWVKLMVNSGQDVCRQNYSITGLKDWSAKPRSYGSTSQHHPHSVPFSSSKCGLRPVILMFIPKEIWLMHVQRLRWELAPWCSWKLKALKLKHDVLPVVFMSQCLKDFQQLLKTMVNLRVRLFLCKERLWTLLLGVWA